MHPWFKQSLAVMAMLGLMGASPLLLAQTVQPIIAEYTGRADGFFEVTNDGAKPQIVVVEPKSFSVKEDGQGQFRPVDSSIQVELSATSVRLEPLQTARIFYKVRSEHLPAWVCLYAVFSAAKRGEGVNVRVMLPHTVYVYQKENLPRSALTFSNAVYDPALHTVTLTLKNTSDLAARAEQIEVTGPHAATATQGGFPVLPQLKRTFQIEWQGAEPPRAVAIHFPKFDVKVPVASAVD